MEIMHLTSQPGSGIVRASEARMRNANSIAIAGGAIINALVKKGVLTP
jgi:hypothetical protein